MDCFQKAAVAINPISIIHKFTYFFIVDIYTLKRNFVKENKKPFKSIKNTTKHKFFFTNSHNREALRTLHIH